MIKRILPILAVVAVTTGCQSLQKRIDDAIPEGKMTKMRATVTGKFSSTTVEAEEFEKTETEVRAVKLHERHSNIWVPNIEVEIEGYVRKRKPSEISPESLPSNGIKTP